MSQGACIFLGSVTFLIGACFVATGIAADADLPSGPLPLYVIGGFCGIIALACFSRRSRPVTLRILGAALCAVYVWYVLGQWGKPVRLNDTTNIFYAIGGLIAFGVPGAYLAITGRYPAWGRWSHAFTPGAAGDPAENDKRDAESESDDWLEQQLPGADDSPPSRRAK
jgi:hypothetical protein